MKLTTVLDRIDLFDLNEAFAAHALGLPARVGHRQRKIERERRRDCDRSPAWLQRRPPGHDADPPDGSHRRRARRRVALRRGRTRLGDGLRTGVSLELGRTVRSFERPAPLQRFQFLQPLRVCWPNS